MIQCLRCNSEIVDERLDGVVRCLPCHPLRWDPVNQSLLDLLDDNANIFAIVTSHRIAEMVKKFRTTSSRLVAQVNKFRDALLQLLNFFRSQMGHQNENTAGNFSQQNCDFFHCICDKTTSYNGKLVIVAKLCDHSPNVVATEAEDKHAIAKVRWHRNILQHATTKFRA